MPESEKPKQSVSAAQSEPTPFQKFQALASALVKVAPKELAESQKAENEKKSAKR